MDKNRIVGAAKEAKGVIKEVIGKAPAMPSYGRTARRTRPRARCRTPSAGLATPCGMW